MAALPAKRGRGHPKVYSDRLFLKALVIMIVRHLHTVHELLCVLAQPTSEMTLLRHLLTEQECFPSRRTWERRLKAIPATLPAQIGCLVLCSSKAIRKETVKVPTCLRRSTSDPGLGPMIELSRSDASRLLNLVGIGKALSGKAHPDERGATSPLGHVEKASLLSE